MFPNYSGNALVHKKFIQICFRYILFIETAGGATSNYGTRFEKQLRQDLFAS